VEHASFFSAGNPLRNWSVLVLLQRTVLAEDQHRRQPMKRQSSTVGAITARSSTLPCFSAFFRVFPTLLLRCAHLLPRFEKYAVSASAIGACLPDGSTFHRLYSTCASEKEQSLGEHVIQKDALINSSLPCLPAFFPGFSRLRVVPFSLAGPLCGRECQSRSNDNQASLAVSRFGIGFDQMRKRPMCK
jgi:hypothetical protein